MADHEQENAREQLTEREREALKILAKEIVREAGSKRDQEMEARREVVKAYADNFRQYLTVSGATAVGAAVIHDVLKLFGLYTVLTLAALALAFTFTEPTS